MQQNQERFRKEHRYVEDHLKATQGVQEEKKKAPTVVKYDDGRFPNVPTPPNIQPATQPTSSPNKTENQEDENEALIAKLM